MTFRRDLFDIFSYVSNGNWTGDTDTYLSKATNSCNLTTYQNAYSSDGLDLYALLQGIDILSVPPLSVENLQGYISSELSNRGIPISDIIVKKTGDTADVKILISNKKATNIQLKLV